MINLKKLQENLVPVMREAGAKIMEIYEKPAQVEYKGDGSPVTLADKAAEAIILPALHAIAPSIPVISEENAASHALIAPDTFFLVDPLDGTKEFLKHDGRGSFTVNIALIKNNRPIFGIVFAPALDRMFSAIVGQTAEETHKGITRTLMVRDIPDDGLVAVASASHRDDETDTWLKRRNIKKTVSIGSSLKFCLIAAGEADIYPRFGPTMEWDTAAGHAVLVAAGGRVTNPDYSNFMYAKPNYRNGAFIAWGKYQPL